MKPKLLTVGKVVNTHGIRGEVKVWPETDFPEERFSKGAELLIVHPDDESRAVPVTVSGSRLHKNVYIVRFEQFQNINEVEQYKGWGLKVPSDQRVKLSRHEFYFHDIIGCEVVTIDGDWIGTVTEILRPGANDVWVVKTTAGKLAYIPYIADVVKEVDPEHKKITIELMEGLLE